MKATLKELLLKLTNTKQNKEWVQIASSTGANSVAFTDLTTQGYTEIYIKDGTYGGALIPISALPTVAVWGGHYGGVNGLLHGVDISSTSMKGRYGQTDSANYLASMTFYLFAR